MRRGYEQFAAGDIEGVATLFAEETELADTGGLGIAGTAAGTRYGREGFIRASADTQEAFDDYRVEPQEFIDVGEAVSWSWFGSPVAERQAERTWKCMSRTCGCSGTAR